MIAYFAFEQSSPDGVVNDFIFKLTSEVKIIEAREILANPLSLKHHVQGSIIIGKASYNPKWSFHLDPDSIGFFEIQAEVCDANVTFVENHLDEIGCSTLPQNFWCPWSSKICREVIL